MRQKYPRTFHLPFSPGCASDDKMHSHFDYGDTEWVVTEKMDGENTTIYCDGYHARSIDSRYHPSRSRIAALQDKIGWGMDSNMRICGENMLAVHSIKYDDLEDYFLMFGVWIDNTCLSWDETLEIAEVFDLKTVPVIYQGVLTPEIVSSIITGLDTTKMEGFVVRPRAEFEMEDFARVVGKYVRADHVQTDTHWSFAKITTNKLREN